MRRKSRKKAEAVILAASVITGLGFADPVRAETDIGGTNVAPDAIASAEKENTPVRNVNDGRLATGSPETSWNTWDGSDQTEYPTPVTLSWDEPMKLSSMEVLWWADNPTPASSDNVTFPKSAELYYHDGDDWVKIDHLINEDGKAVDSVGVKYNKGSGINGANTYWNGVSFDEITTDKLQLRVDRSGTDSNGIGISEWKAYGEADNSSLWSAAIDGKSVISQGQTVTFSGGYRPSALEGDVSYDWEVIDSEEEYKDKIEITGDTASQKVEVKAKNMGVGKLQLKVTHGEDVKSAIMEVRVDGLEKIEDYVTSTAAGKAPILPDRVVGDGLVFDTPTPDKYGKNGYNFSEEFNAALLPVEWDMNSFDENDYEASGNTFEVTGHVTYADQKYPAKAVISVEDPMTVQHSNSAVTFENIHLTDDFWLPKQKVNAVNSLNAAIYRISLPSGGEPNFVNAIKRLNGEDYSEFQGFVFQDTDIYKTLEAISYTLSVIESDEDPQMIEQKEKLKEVAARWISYIEQVQYADGYLNTCFALRANTSSGADSGNSATHRWFDMSRHEMYCLGHFFEAAVAYTRYTEGIGQPDYRLYVAAKRAADHVNSLFGEGGTRDGEVPGHEEIELGLVKLSKLVEENEGEGTGEKYVALGKHLIDGRGKNYEKRASGYNGGNYSQDHLPFVEQDNAVGHSVRAAYLYSGASDIAAMLPEDDSDRIAYLNILDSINERVTNKNTYLTGAVGIQGNSEGFGNDYELDPAKSYGETCAGIAMAMWNQRMNLVHEDAKYIDNVERVLYNNVLAGTNLDGDQFYYDSLLDVTNGNARSDWFACACCPPNLMRTIASISGYMYSVHSDDLFVNLYIGSEGSVNVNGTKVGIKQETEYPWEGSVGITLNPETKKEFTMNLRIPKWVSEQDNQDIKITVKSGEEETDIPAETEKGYVKITRTWNPGDVIQLDMPMEVRLTEADKNVAATVGKVAIERGPIVYAMERAGNNDLNNNADFDPHSFMIPQNAKFDAVYQDSLLNGVVEITSDDVFQNDADTPARLQAIPYYAWNNRGDNGVENPRQNNSSKMVIWVNEVEREDTDSNADTTSLKSLIAMLEGMTGQKDNFTADSWKNMEEQLDQAKSLLDQPDLTQETVDDMFLSLLDSYLNLENGVLKTGLKAAIDYADKFLADQDSLQDYTDESIAALQEALASAKTVYGTDYTDVTEGRDAVREATNRLIEATINLIQQEPVDKERLQKLADYAKTILETADDYTAASVKDLDEALTSAASVLENKKASEEEVTEAYDALANALMGLVPKGDKAELEHAIAVGDKILNNADQYLAESLEGLEETLQNAKRIFDKEDATQEEVNDALKDLITECMEARLLGDVDKDGEVNSQDSAAVLRAAAELTDLTEDEKQAADVNRDGKISTDDASGILEYAAELIEKF